MTRLWLGILWLLHATLPAAFLARLGSGLGSLLYRLAVERRNIVHTNLKLCFPEQSPFWREQVARDHFRAFGQSMLLETVSWWGNQTELERLVRVEGREHLSQRKGQPVILLAPHFLGLNIAFVRLSTEFAPLVTIYARIKNPALDRLMFNSRSRFGSSRLHSRQEGIRPVLGSIKQGLPFYYLPDMDYGRKDAIFVPFFGVPTATITGLTRITRATGAVVVPAITRWNGSHYVVQLYPAWEGYPSSDVVADTRRMNAFIEDRILEMPEQYFWLHKRFKTRPEGEDSLYG